MIDARELTEIVTGNDDRVGGRHALALIHGMRAKFQEAGVPRPRIHGLMSSGRWYPATHFAQIFRDRWTMSGAVASRRPHVLEDLETVRGEVALMLFWWGDQRLGAFASRDGTIVAMMVLTDSRVI